MLHSVIAFNQILGHPLTYISPGRLFSSHRFNNVFVKDPDRLFFELSETASAMFKAITKDILPLAIAEPTGAPSRAVLSQTPRLSTQNRFDLLSSK